MIFIYPYKRRENDFLINHSTRLVKKYYPDAEIYTIGDKVEGLKNMPCTDSYQDRGANVTKKCLLAANHFEEFIYMNDDFFINDRLDFNRVYGGSEDLDRKEGKASIAWQQATDNTKHWLQHNGFNVRTYEVHQPVKFNSYLLIQLMSNIDWTKNNHFIKSLYFNVYEPLNIIQMENVKLIRPNLVKAQRYLDIYGCLSVGGDFCSEVGANFIKSL
jgi:hypothetical protein